MILIKRRNQFNNIVIEKGTFLLYSSAIKYLKQFSDSNKTKIEVKIFDGNKTNHNKQCFHKYEEAINFLKQKNGEG